MTLFKSLILFLVFSSVLLSRPKGVPDEAEFSEDINRYELEERLSETLTRVRYWDETGQLKSDTFRQGDVYESTHYIDGRWYSRERYKFPNIKDAEKLPPKERAASIPISAVFNFDFQKWELGDVSSGKKQGKFKLWWVTGEEAGTVEYENGVYHGILDLHYEAGQKYRFKKYLNGKIEGESITYFDNGQIREFANFVNGSIKGDRLIYEKNGNLKYKDSFKDGSIQQSETYENGKLKERKTFKDRKVIKTEKF